MCQRIERIERIEIMDTFKITTPAFLINRFNAQKIGLPSNRLSKKSQLRLQDKFNKFIKFKRN